MAEPEALIFEKSDDNVATITINRPDKLNAFTQAMLRDFQALWHRIQRDDTIHSVVLRAAGERAFSTGVDQREPREPVTNLWSAEDPGTFLCPKANGCWKPVVTAVNGMAAGGAFYLLNESDIAICADDASFFDPHVTYGMTSALEPIGMTYRMLLGDVLRMVLLGNDERISAETALKMGIVSEIVPTAQLWSRAHAIAAKIALKPSIATQGSVKAIWESLDLPRSAALRIGYLYPQLANPTGTAAVDRARVMAAAKEFDTI